MAHIGASDDDWANAKVGVQEKRDLFYCDCCKIDFNIDSAKRKGKQVFCPLCRHGLIPWQKDWERPSI